MNQWQQMVLDLREKDFTQTYIASVMGCSQNYVSDLERGVCGKRLSYAYGEKLKQLWKKHCSRKQTKQEA